MAELHLNRMRYLFLCRKAATHSTNTAAFCCRERQKGDRCRCTSVTVLVHLKNWVKSFSLMNLFIKVGSMQYKEKFCDEEIMRSHSVPLRAVLTCLGPWSSQANGAPMGVDGRLLEMSIDTHWNWFVVLFSLWKLHGLLRLFHEIEK